MDLAHFRYIGAFQRAEDESEDGFSIFEKLRALGGGEVPWEP